MSGSCGERQQSKCWNVGNDAVCAEGVVYQCSNHVCWQRPACLPGTGESVKGGGGGMKGSRVLSASYSQLVELWGPCFPVPPGSPNMMSGSSFQGSTSNSVSTWFSSSRSESGNAGGWSVTVFTGSSSCEVDDKLRSDLKLILQF